MWNKGSEKAEKSRNSKYFIQVSDLVKAGCKPNEFHNTIALTGWRFKIIIYEHLWLFDGHFWREKKTFMSKKCFMRKPNPERGLFMNIYDSLMDIFDEKNKDIVDEKNE